jgi:hypothetical protein
MGTVSGVNKGNPVETLFSGKISWIAMYHKDRRVSGIQAACRLLQIRCQSKLGCSVSTRHGLAGVAAEAIVCNARYRRVRIFLTVSSDGGCGTLAMSVA